MASWEDVRRTAGKLPDAEESTQYRQPAFKVKGKTFASMSTRMPQTLVVRCRREDRALLVDARPDVYFFTPHYEGWDGVLIRLDAVDDDELAGAIEDAYAFVTEPKRKART